MIIRVCLFLFSLEAMALPLLSQASDIQTRSFSLQTSDGLKLQGRLDFPAGSHALPTIIILQGAGPLNVDMALLEPNNPGATCRRGWKDDCRIDKQLARELAKQGFAVVRLGKRGTWVDEDNPNHLRVDYLENSTSTISARMNDLDLLLTKIQSFAEVDSERLHLVGVSEGTIIAQRAMAILGSRLKSMVLIGAVLGSGLDLYRTQIVDIAYDLLLQAADRNHDGLVARAEYDLEQLRMRPSDYDFFSPAFFRTIKDLERLGINPSFEFFDLDGDGHIVRSEVQYRVFHEIYSKVVAAVADNDATALASLPDDDYSYNYNTLAQFAEWFSEPSRAQQLARSPVPVTILFGEADLNTSPRQLDWFLPIVWSVPNSQVSWKTIVGEGHYGPRLAEETVTIFFP
jgi:pimeloyl-ACP methyl ester carboxylesterase